MFRIERETATQLADALLKLEGVHELHSGRFGEVALLYPQARVVGLRIDDEALEVHVVAQFGHDYQALAHNIRETVHQYVTLPDEYRIDVLISDLVAPDAAENTAETTKEK